MVSLFVLKRGTNITLLKEKQIIKEIIYKKSSPQARGKQRSNQERTSNEKMDKLAAIINNILIEAHRISDYTKKIEDNAAIQKG